MTQAKHIPVMSAEILDWIAPKPGGKYLDGTLGLGGHSLAVLHRTRGRARILGIDKDPQALDQAEKILNAAGYKGCVEYAHGSFAHFRQALQETGWAKVHGAILDLGFSSWQLDDPERGFSFIHDGALDMRLDPGSGLESAAALVNRRSREQLKKIIREYGQEPMAGRIAGRIVERRQKKPIESTQELAEIIKMAYPPKMRHTARNHPATRSFQAFRIAVNSELEDLNAFLEKIPGSVQQGGRVAVISFHSLEDRIVKHWFRHHARDCTCPPEQLYCRCEHQAVLKVLTKKPLTPGQEEIRDNPRARSAKLRVAEALV
ncbi:MAG: 16S rRNA (cytosine(1402)-N(4))-methyltransferase RsmH [Desulfohalobiaceae bacterium]|nr:16S rRNA (cytosine(1402)-N(4))-methyltransferase RsmH [Desulfohalobiaceae bacterium]